MCAVGPNCEEGCGCRTCYERDWKRKNRAATRAPRLCGCGAELQPRCKLCAECRAAGEVASREARKVVEKAEREAAKAAKRAVVVAAPRICETEGCGLPVTSVDPRARFHSTQCSQLDWRRKHPKSNAMAPKECAAADCTVLISGRYTYCPEHREVSARPRLEPEESVPFSDVEAFRLLFPPEVPDYEPVPFCTEQIEGVWLRRYSCSEPPRLVEQRRIEVGRSPYERPDTWDSEDLAELEVYLKGPCLICNQDDCQRWEKVSCEHLLMSNDAN